MASKASKSKTTFEERQQRREGKVRAAAEEAQSRQSTGAGAEPVVPQAAPSDAAGAVFRTAWMAALEATLDEVAPAGGGGSRVAGRGPLTVHVLLVAGVGSEPRRVFEGVTWCRWSSGGAVLALRQGARQVSWPRERVLCVEVVDAAAAGAKAPGAGEAGAEAGGGLAPPDAAATPEAAPASEATAAGAEEAGDGTT